MKLCSRCYLPIRPAEREHTHSHAHAPETKSLLTHCRETQTSDGEARMVASPELPASIRQQKLLRGRRRERGGGGGALRCCVKELQLTVLERRDKRQTIRSTESARIQRARTRAASRTPPRPQEQLRLDRSSGRREEGTFRGSGAQLWGQTFCPSTRTNS